MFATIIICTIINIIILSIMYIFFRKKLEKAVTSTELVDNIRKEIDELVVELNHTTDRNIELIEEKIGRLNRLLKDADNRIVALNRSGEDRAVKDTYEDIVSRRRPQAKDEGPAEPTKRERVLSLAAQGIDTSIIAGKLGLTLGEVELIVSLETSRGGDKE